MSIIRINAKHEFGAKVKLVQDSTDPSIGIVVGYKLEPESSLLYVIRWGHDAGVYESSHYDFELTEV